MAKPKTNKNTPPKKAAPPKKGKPVKSTKAVKAAKPVKVAKVAKAEKPVTTKKPKRKTITVADAVSIPPEGYPKVLDDTLEPEELLANCLALQEKLELLEPYEASEDPKKASQSLKTLKPLSHEDLIRVNSKKGMLEIFQQRNIDLHKVTEILKYEEELALLQIELVKLQAWLGLKQSRVAILFEGRDAAGKGGTIRRFTEHLNPRAIRVVALPKPTEEERGQWYFQRYTRQLPNPGEIVFFDRSWYNRAVVEPVNGFCTREQYEVFIRQVPEFEHMLYEDGLHLIKFWFSISKKEQQYRFESRARNPLKQWKLSPVDKKAQALWHEYTHYKEEMLGRTHSSFSPWIIVQANNKRVARLESIRYVLSLFPYEGKEDAPVRLVPDPNIITRFHRRILKID